MNSRQLGAKGDCCRMRWLLNMPMGSAGRSAVIRTKGIFCRDASATAGARLSTAVPEVVTTPTGSPSCRAIPSAT